VTGPRVIGRREFFHAMKRVLALALLALTSAAFARAQQPAPPQQSQTPPAQTPAPQPTPAPAEAHEYAPLQEREINYKDWTFKSARDGEQRVNLRDWSRGKRLVLVVYFAPWCRNWKLEAPVVARLYEKYRDAGFDVVAVSDYGTTDEIKAYFDQHPAHYAVVVESDSSGAREKTAHYAYRQQTGDARKWGSPYNVFLEPAKLSAKGDVLAAKVWIANGELVEHDAEQFIRERLGLPADAKIED
jgi:thiol-disulfide isomerase/thioredoxin